MESYIIPFMLSTFSELLAFPLKKLNTYFY
jgi:hypothetical protein